jgi:acyl-CoA synthetase (AMP-forming)/AMP-acid ligase II
MSPGHFMQRPVRWLAAISRYRATHSGGPNFAYDLCVQRISAAELAQLDLSSWEAAFNGAEPIRARTLEAFAQQFSPSGFNPRSFFSCYGLAEATLFVSGVRKQSGVPVTSLDGEALAHGQARPAAHEGASRLVSCGSPSPGTTVRIVNPENGTPLADGTVGEIWVAGPAVAQGYWQLEEPTARTFHAHPAGDDRRFLRTGDLGFVLDGNLYVTGRIKDVMILRGRNIYPHDIELTVASCRDVLIAGGGASFIEEHSAAEHLVIVQELRNKVQLDLPALIDDIAATVLDAHEVQPDRIVLIGAGALPKTSSGKVRRSATREALQAGQLPILAEMRRNRM